MNSDPVFSDRQARHDDVRALALEHAEHDFGRVPVEMPGERGFVIQLLPTERPSTHLAAFMQSMNREFARRTGWRF